MFSVYQHWDPLKVCILGRSYPPEFYSWIQNPKTRSLFERIAIETEEDYQTIQKKLEEFGVEVLRPNLPENQSVLRGSYVKPPMTPRDTMIMVGETFYECFSMDFDEYYNRVRDPLWPDCHSVQEAMTLPKPMLDELYQLHGFADYSEYQTSVTCYDDIIKRVKTEGNQVKSHVNTMINGAMISRIGQDLYFGTEAYDQELDSYRKLIDSEFTNTRNHIINTGGHGDGTYCPVTPGLIISLHDVPTYADTFPDWEVLYLPGQSFDAVQPFMDLKDKNHGKWWIPGHEYEDDVLLTVETWLKDWVGYVEETVFDINMLVIDPKNVIVFNYNKQVFDALARYGVTPHICNFRHRFFWDGGIHCVTTDLHREGTRQNFFPVRG